MKFLTIFTPDSESREMPHPAHNQAMATLIDDMTRDGSLISTGGVGPNPQLAKVRRKKGKLSVVDGPFSEAKELIGGFAILEARDLAHAIEMAKRFASIAGDGETEIFSIMMIDDGVPTAPSP
ncbi:MAG TPA: YciI family protein [Kofleriaceae bacterium]|jgi:hypothetical protein|nr:YciI family protein [Kofleriaceae bacterium]